MEFEFKYCPHCGKSIKIALKADISFLEKPTEKEIKEMELH